MLTSLRRLLTLCTGNMGKSESSSTTSEPEKHPYLNHAPIVGVDQPRMQDCELDGHEFEREVDHGMDDNNPDRFHDCLECLYCDTLICEVE
ncbi:hypothetical protein LCGC14_2481130 [marine sediment metagenome]|uniref:Uncharacterized protein n=1 Tax=marine sediment metagenome TaxID=412755 RepID=A0A0F9B8D7_9ZZZZ